VIDDVIGASADRVVDHLRRAAAQADPLG